MRVEGVTLLGRNAPPPPPPVQPSSGAAGGLLVFVLDTSNWCHTEDQHGGATRISMQKSAMMCIAAQCKPDRIAVVCMGGAPSRVRLALLPTREWRGGEASDLSAFEPTCDPLVSEGHLQAPDPHRFVVAADRVLEVLRAHRDDGWCVPRPVLGFLCSPPSTFRVVKPQIEERMSAFTSLFGEPGTHIDWMLHPSAYASYVYDNCAVEKISEEVRAQERNLLCSIEDGEAFMDAFDTASLCHEVSYIDFVNTLSCYSVHFCGTADIDALRSAWLACFGDNDGFPEHAMAWRRDMEEVARWKPYVDSGALDADSVGVL